MRWREALNHALRLADEGHETTIHVHAQPDASVERTATIRVTKASISDLNDFFADSKNDGLDIRKADEYFELS
jgi:hypothetical protein